MNVQTRTLLESKLTSSRLIEPIKLADTVHSWLNMLNRVIDVCNVVEYPNPDKETATYSNVFGFMESTDKLYLDGTKWGIFPADDEEAIDIDVRNLHSRHFSREAKFTTVDPSVPDSTGEIVVDRTSIDVQCVDAKADVLLTLVASPDPTWHAEKLVSIKALQDVYVEYSGNDFSFVNNSIYPNVEWSSIGTPKKTLLLSGTFIVYRATFIHSRVLLEVVENTQLVDNYKAASAKAADSSLNGTLEFDANAEMLGNLTRAVNEDPNRVLYMNYDGVVGTTFEAGRCRATFELNAVESDTAQWESVTLTCRPYSSDALLESNLIVLQDGRHVVQCWSNDRMKVVKVDYALNMAARAITILGFSTIAMKSGRTYDE